jgi:hypothetical protein
MNADLDLNNNDLINAGTVDADNLVVAGTNLNSVVAQAATSATNAAASASSAAASAATASQYTPAYFTDVAALLADTRSWPTGQILNTREEGFAYEVVTSGQHVTTAGGVKLIVLPDQDGAYCINAFSTTVNPTVIEAAIAAVAAAAASETFTSFAAQSSIDLIFRPGEYTIDSQIDVAGSSLNYNLRCSGGRATFVGANPSVNKCFVFGAVRNITFENLNFIGFTTATEWDTDNIDTSLIRYLDCEFINCTLGVDTVSYSQSRSTVLVLDRCRAGGTGQLVKSFCDMTIINDGHFRSASNNGAFIFADSQLIIRGGVFTPYVASNGSARWVDIDNSSSAAPRSVLIENARFGPENSGIPIIFSNLAGVSAGGSRTTMTYITLLNVYSSSTNALDKRCGIVLRSDTGGTATICPNQINIYGGSINGADGMVVSEAGLTPDLAVGRFSINIDNAAQTRWGDVTTAPSTPVVESILEKYVSNWRIENTTITSTGTITPSVGFKKRLSLQPASATTVTNLIDALDGHMVVLLFRNSNVTISDLSTGGSFDLSGSADFIGSANSTLTVMYDRSSSRWKEISRSVN